MSARGFRTGHLALRSTPGSVSARGWNTWSRAIFRLKAFLAGTIFPQMSGASVDLYQFSANGKFYLASGGRFDRSSMEASAAIKPAQAQPILAAISAPASCGSLGPVGVASLLQLPSRQHSGRRDEVLDGSRRDPFRVPGRELRNSWSSCRSTCRADRY